MGIRPVLFALGALALAGCVSNDYGYAYCYDPYRGPVGYHYGPFEPAPACAATTAAVPAAYVVYENGYRGPYVSGPYTAPAPTPEEAR